MRKALKDGDEVCQGTGMRFMSEERLLEFLKAPGCQIVCRNCLLLDFSLGRNVAWTSGLCLLDSLMIVPTFGYLRINP